MLYGIDVSNYQSGINFAAVPADFVFIKATGGPAYVNPALGAMDDRAAAAGKSLRGFYHFSGDGWPNTTAEEEADHFINTVRSRQAGHALVLDWESPGPIQNPAWALTWLRRVTAAFGRKPWVYANGQALSYDMSAIAAEGYPLWHAFYSDRPITGYNPDMARPAARHFGQAPMWQFTQYGQLSGFSGPLDLNAFYGDADDFRRLSGLAAATPPLLIPDLPGIFKP